MYHRIDLFVAYNNTNVHEEYKISHINNSDLSNVITQGLLKEYWSICKRAQKTDKNKSFKT